MPIRLSRMDSSQNGGYIIAVLLKQCLRITHIRQGKLWVITIMSTVIALASAVGSVVSAACAYYALHLH